MKTLTVPLAHAPYAIHIGAHLLERAGVLMASVLRRPRVFIVTDDTVAPLHLNRLLSALDSQGIVHDHTMVRAGESSKSFPTLERVIDTLLGARVERSTTLVALGGGVIGDLTGFAAAIFLRGVDFIQIPTTLLAQVDSSVGGKTGINTSWGKNLVGAFHQPRLVLADTSTLDTLKKRDLLAGYAEIVKTAAIGDERFFSWLETHGPAVIGGDENARTEAIARSCEAKARIVGVDERESGLRALLNFGHTFGHALEAETGFGETLRHGEAVALGMIMAMDLSVRVGECPPGDLKRLQAHLDRVGLPTRLASVPNAPVWNAGRLLSHMSLDKKVSDGRVSYILSRGIGRAFVDRNVDPGMVEETVIHAIHS